MYILYLLPIGKLFGRGSTDDKGPVLAWFNCIEAYQKIQQVWMTVICCAVICFSSGTCPDFEDLVAILLVVMQVSVVALLKINTKPRYDYCMGLDTF